MTVIGGNLVTSGGQGDAGSRRSGLADGAENSVCCVVYQYIVAGAGSAHLQRHGVAARGQGAKIETVAVSWGRGGFGENNLPVAGLYHLYGYALLGGVGEAHPEAAGIYLGEGSGNGRLLGLYGGGGKERNHGSGSGNERRTEGGGGEEVHGVGG